jgi:hypothetical protein
LIFLRALRWLACCRLGLRFLPFRSLQTILGTTGKKLNQVYNMDTCFIEQITLAVGRASKCLPHSTCLAQALVIKILLAQCGQASQVLMGVKKNENGGLEAHAWVESQGQIIGRRPENLLYQCKKVLW